MAVQQNRKSRSRRDMRRSHDALTENALTVDQAVQRANELEAKYGERFKAPQRLVESVPSGQIR